MNIYLPTVSFYHWNIIRRYSSTPKAPPRNENIKKHKSYDLLSKPNQLPSQTHDLQIMRSPGIMVKCLDFTGESLTKGCVLMLAVRP